MFAEEMHGWEVQGAAAGGASTGLEDGGFGAEVGDFLSFALGFGAVAFDQMPVLYVRR